MKNQKQPVNAISMRFMRIALRVSENDVDRWLSNKTLYGHIRFTGFMMCHSHGQPMEVGNSIRIVTISTNQIVLSN